MPKGIYIRSKEHGERISKALKGRKYPPFTDEWRKNISISHKGKKFSEEHRRRIGLVHLIGESKMTHSETNRRYYLKNPERVKKLRRERERERRSSDIFYRINSNIGRAINHCLKGNKKGRHWETIVGYTLEDLISRIEKLFDENMSWDNYGTCWEIDHIKPKSLFNEGEVRECWALENLQPLLKEENRKKWCHYKPLDEEIIKRLKE